MVSNSKLFRAPGMVCNSKLFRVPDMVSNSKLFGALGMVSNSKLLGALVWSSVITVNIWYDFKRIDARYNIYMYFCNLEFLIAYNVRMT
jgi:hypothetical protein